MNYSRDFGGSISGVIMRQEKLHRLVVIEGAEFMPRFPRIRVKPCSFRGIKE